MANKVLSIAHIEDSSSTTSGLPVDEKAPQLKVNSKGLVLVPQPSNDPRDPLVSIQSPPIEVSDVATDLPTTELDGSPQASDFNHCLFGFVHLAPASST
jgi:hypothetical protein